MKTVKLRKTSSSKQPTSAQKPESDRTEPLSPVALKPLPKPRLKKPDQKNEGDSSPRVERSPNLPVTEGVFESAIAPKARPASYGDEQSSPSWTQKSGPFKPAWLNLSLKSAASKQQPASDSKQTPEAELAQAKFGSESPAADVRKQVSSPEQDRNSTSPEKRRKLTGTPTCADGSATTTDAITAEHSKQTTPDSPAESASNLVSPGDDDGSPSVAEDTKPVEVGRQISPEAAVSKTLTSGGFTAQDTDKGNTSDLDQGANKNLFRRSSNSSVDESKEPVESKRQSVKDGAKKPVARETDKIDVSDNPFFKLKKTSSQQPRERTAVQSVSEGLLRDNVSNEGSQESAERRKLASVKNFAMQPTRPKLSASAPTTPTATAVFPSSENLIQGNPAAKGPGANSKTESNTPTDVELRSGKTSFNTPASLKSTRTNDRPTAGEAVGRAGSSPCASDFPSFNSAFPVKLRKTGNAFGQRQPVTSPDDVHQERPVTLDSRNAAPSFGGGKRSAKVRNATEAEPVASSKQKSNKLVSPSITSAPAVVRSSSSSEASPPTFASESGQSQLSGNSRSPSWNKNNSNISSSAASSGPPLKPKKPSEAKKDFPELVDACARKTPPPHVPRKPTLVPRRQDSKEKLPFTQLTIVENPYEPLSVISEPTQPTVTTPDVRTERSEKNAPEQDSEAISWISLARRRSRKWEGMIDAGEIKISLEANDVSAAADRNACISSFWALKCAVRCVVVVLVKIC